MAREIWPPLALRRLWWLVRNPAGVEPDLANLRGTVPARPPTSQTSYYQNALFSCRVSGDKCLWLYYTAIDLGGSDFHTREARLCTSCVRTTVRDDIRLALSSMSKEDAVINNTASPDRNDDRSVSTSPGVHEGLVALTSGMAFGPSKKLLSFSILKLAGNALTRCKRRAPNDPMMDILEVYILSVAGLEALANEICLDQIDQRRERKKSTSALRELVDDSGGHYVDLKTKFDRLPQSLWKLSFDKSGETWCDFDALIKLRNDLVHYTPLWEEPGYVPSYLRSIYRRVLRQIARPPNEGTFPESWIHQDTSFVARICSIEMGQWAFDAARAMIRELFALWPRRDTMRGEYVCLFDRAGIDLDR